MHKITFNDPLTFSDETPCYRIKPDKPQPNEWCIVQKDDTTYEVFQFNPVAHKDRICAPFIGQLP